MNEITTHYGHSVRLPNIEESEKTEEIQLRIAQARGPSNTAYTTGLASQQTFVGRGTVSGMQLAEWDRYSDDPLVACAEWYDDVHRLVNGAQGEGNEYTNGDRDETHTVAIRSLSTTRYNGQPFTIAYQFDFVEGDITLPDLGDDPVPDRTVDPDNTCTLAGIDLGTILERVDETSEEMTVNPPADRDADPSNTKVYREADQNAAIRRINLRGRVTTDKNTFDAQISSIAGDNQIHTFATAFPGYDLEVMVGEEWTSKRVSGQANVTEYTIQLTEGRKVE